MSETTTNPAEKPVNDGGGGSAPQSESPTPTEGQGTADTTGTEGGGSE